jgi:hypothetical protein
VLRQIRQQSRHAEEADLALIAQGDHLLDRAVGLHLLPARRHVDLEQVQVIGA